MYIKVSKDRM